MRYFFITIALWCILALVGSYFVENVLSMEPCVLCAMQRLLFTWILGTCIFGLLIDFIFNTSIIVNILTCFFLFNIMICDVIGILIAGRQSWLQSLPKNIVHNNVYSCSAGLEQLILQHPISMVFKIALKGSLECSEVKLRILGLSLANWSLIGFIMILLFGIVVVYRWYETCTK